MNATSEAKTQTQAGKVPFVYEGKQTGEISFPLGGIGTGSIGLAGTGQLIDWEIFNRPNKNSFNGFSFFAVRAEADGEIVFAKVLNGDLQTPYSGVGREKFKGFGFGPPRESLAGMPHYAATRFRGEYPLATVDFIEEGAALQASLVAFNPYIPLNDKDSSLPAALLEYTITNRTARALDVSVVGNITNPHKKGALNQYYRDDAVHGIRLSSEAYAADAAEFGDITVSCDGEVVGYQSYWYRGSWFDNLTVFWKEFTTPGKFKERNYSTRRDSDFVYNALDVCLLSSERRLQAGESGTFRFLVTWSFPNYVNYWNPGEGADRPPSWKNHYATLFPDSRATAAYIWTHWARLYGETKQFHDLLFSSTLPAAVIDAISSNISILKSPTVARLTDGTLYGFEGCHADVGSCEGSCTHVWNYEQVTPFLFPGLARSMREVDYRATQFTNGKMRFRLMLPVERTCVDVSACQGPEKAAADGQMGGIVKTYREWLISGDTDWLRSLWPKVKKALEFAWEPTNADGWDRDKDGVMEGAQHHTLDVDIFGPNSYITGYYHAALLAASRMAAALDDRAAAEQYLELYDKGRQWVDAHLFNGEYFHQRIDLQDARFPIDPELGEIKYQIGEGCHIDQVIGQWYSHIVGLGYIFDEQKVKSAVNAIYKYNFATCLRDYPNACRIYALNDEGGLLICTWPRGNGPQVPVPYADECMNGFEYQAACHMIYEGMVEEGLSVVKAIRDRYDGERRNPWNEFECGSNYVRSMASYSLLLSLSGFEFDTANRSIGFNPRIRRERFRCFWSLNKGWGSFAYDDGQLSLQVAKGELALQTFSSDLLADREVMQVSVGNVEIAYRRQGNGLTFADAVILNEAAGLIVKCAG